MGLGHFLISLEYVVLSVKNTLAFFLGRFLLEG